MKKQSSIYLTAIYLKSHCISYIHDLKKCTKANNPMMRVSELRNIHGWKIKTVKEGVVKGVVVYYYKLIKAGRMPKAN